MYISACKKISENYMKEAKKDTISRQILERCVLFEGLDDEELRLAMDFFDSERRLYQKNDIIHMPGKQMESFGLLISGMICVCKVDKEGNRIVMAEVSPGETFGESLCYLKIPEPHISIYAEENASILWLSADNIAKKTEKDDFCVMMTERFIKMLAERTLSLNNRIQILSKKSLKDKILYFLKDAAEKNKSNTFSVQLNREDMASYLGTDRSALSRELSVLKKDGIIDFYKNTFCIKNV